MSLRGKLLFDRYVQDQLRDPVMGSMPLGTHTFNLTMMAAEAGIPMAEVVEEVGPLAPALRSARTSPSRK